MEYGDNIKINRKIIDFVVLNKFCPEEWRNVVTKLLVQLWLLDEAERRFKAVRFCRS